MDVIVVGMPRAGSEAFHALMTRIGEDSGAFRVENPVGGGRQHLAASGPEPGTPVFVIWRDILDALVSAYFYIRDFDGRGEKHPLHAEVEGRSMESAIDFLSGDYFRIRLCQWLRDYQNHEWATLFRFEDVFFKGAGVYIRTRLMMAGYIVPIETIEAALESVSFDKMRGIDPVHYRTGRIGTYREYLTRDQIDSLLKTAEEMGCYR